MPQIKKLSPERFLEIKGLVKLYLALVVLIWSFLLILKIPAPVNIPLDNNGLNMVKFNLQSFIANGMTLQVYMLSLLLYTGYVGMETFEFLRDCAGRLYFRYKNNQVDN